MILRCSAAVALLWLPFLSAAQPAEKPLADLVLVRQGALPIILTAPHGGREAIPGIEPRQDRTHAPDFRRWGGFQRGTDGNTDVLTERIAAQIAQLTGKEPYLVVAKFERKYIDANRPAELALDSPAARPYYDYYHAAIRRFIDEVNKTYPAGVLIDVHGQGKDPYVVMRGTVNGRTVRQLVQRAGVEAVTGPRGIFGALEANGFRVFPGNDVPPAGSSEDAGFNGGYTVSVYGSQNRDGIDTVQMEFGTRYRDRPALDRSARGAAQAIVTFYEAYLKQTGAK